MEKQKLCTRKQFELKSIYLNHKKCVPIRTHKKIAYEKSSVLYLQTYKQTTQYTEHFNPYTNMIFNMHKFIHTLFIPPCCQYVYVFCVTKQTIRILENYCSCCTHTLIYNVWRQWIRINNIYIFITLYIYICV